MLFQTQSVYLLKTVIHYSADSITHRIIIIIICRYTYLQNRSISVSLDLYQLDSLVLYQQGC